MVGRRRAGEQAASARVLGTGIASVTPPSDRITGRHLTSPARSVFRKARCRMIACPNNWSQAVSDMGCGCSRSCECLSLPRRFMRTLGVVANVFKPAGSRAGCHFFAAPAGVSFQDAHGRSSGHQMAQRYLQIPGRFRDLCRRSERCHPVSRVR